jgi:tripartite-type tricarboxylate transporter receptor subunit TctC
MKLPRRQFLHLAAGAAALPAVSRIAGAQAYPARPITVIDAFAPGGATEIAARIVGQHMSRTLGQPFIIENVPGAGGTTGSTRAMQAKPDGYTIQVGNIGTHAFSVSFYPNLAYRPDIDFEPIGLIAEQPLLIVARKDFPAKDLKEFIAYVKANAEQLKMAHVGVGSAIYTFSLLLNSLLGRLWPQRQRTPSAVIRHSISDLPAKSCADRWPGSVLAGDRRSAALADIAGS